MIIQKVNYRSQRVRVTIGWREFRRYGLEERSIPLDLPLQVVYPRRLGISSDETGSLRPLVAVEIFLDVFCHDQRCGWSGSCAVGVFGRLGRVQRRAVLCTVSIMGQDQPSLGSYILELSFR